jgi:hypothetical protein
MQRCPKLFLDFFASLAIAKSTTEFARPLPGPQSQISNMLIKVRVGLRQSLVTMRAKLAMGSETSAVAGRASGLLARPHAKVHSAAQSK